MMKNFQSESKRSGDDYENGFIDEVRYVDYTHSSDRIPLSAKELFDDF